MKTTVYTRWGSDTIAVSADWAQASSQVEGDEHGRQVADFKHSPSAALRATLEDCARIEGMNDKEATQEINSAMRAATYSNEYLQEYHENN